MALNSRENTCLSSLLIGLECLPLPLCPLIALDRVIKLFAISRIIALNAMRNICMTATLIYSNLFEFLRRLIAFFGAFIEAICALTHHP